MIMATKHDVLKDHLKDWLEARRDKKKKGEIIKMICEAIRIHPKSVPRAFKRLQLEGKEPKARSGRPNVYTPDVLAALRTVWDVGDSCCGELLHPMIPEYVNILKRDHEWDHADAVTEKLLQMSLGTVKRHALVLQKKHGIRRGISSTKPSSLKAIIPIFKGPWKDVAPGNGQIDTVAHCGMTLHGDFIYSLNYTDAATYWVVLRAQWNKGQLVTQQNLDIIRGKLPFPLIGLHPDTGSEFINWHLKKWCDAEQIGLSRSEPGKKNDNMYVEERNGHVVRRHIGSMVLNCRQVVSPLNAFYDVLTPYLMHFVAVRRMLHKIKEGSNYKRVYEKVAKTPYQRILEHQAVSEENKEKLRREHDTLNPAILKKEMEKRLQKVFKTQQRFGNPRS